MGGSGMDGLGNYSNVQGFGEKRYFAKVIGAVAAGSLANPTPVTIQYFNQAGTFAPANGTRTNIQVANQIASGDLLIQELAFGFYVDANNPPTFVPSSSVIPGNAYNPLNSLIANGALVLQKNNIIVFEISLLEFVRPYVVGSTGVGFSTFNKDQGYGRIRLLNPQKLESDTTFNFSLVTCNTDVNAVGFFTEAQMIGRYTYSPKNR
jgi:hypothetical protein